MLCRSRPPAPRLDEFIEYFWKLRDAPGHSHERIVATGALELGERWVATEHPASPTEDL